MATEAAVQDVLMAQQEHCVTTILITSLVIILLHSTVHYLMKQIPMKYSGAPVEKSAVFSQSFIFKSKGGHSEPRSFMRHILYHHYSQSLQ